VGWSGGGGGGLKTKISKESIFCMKLNLDFKGVGGGGQCNLQFCSKVSYHRLLPIETRISFFPEIVLVIDQQTLFNLPGL